MERLSLVKIEVSDQLLDKGKELSPEWAGLNRTKTCDAMLRVAIYALHMEKAKALKEGKQ
jgi:hypothetical protein